jgi:hypothetical protein
MTDTSYLYQYFLEKSPENKKAKESIHPSETVKKKSIKEKITEEKSHE